MGVILPSNYSQAWFTVSQASQYQKLQWRFRRYSWLLVAHSLKRSPEVEVSINLFSHYLVIIIIINE